MSRRASRDDSASKLTRFNPLDTTWAGHFTGVAVTPVATPSLSRMRDVWRQVSREHPDAALVGRVEPRGWVSVSESERERFVEETIVPITDPGPDEVDAFVVEEFGALPADRPIRVGIGERSLLLLVSHQLGDGATVTSLIQALLAADADAIGTLTRTATLRDVARAFRAQVRPHGREWLAIARAQLASRGAAHSATPVKIPAAGSWETSMVSVRWTPEQVRLLSAWRTRNARGSTLTGLMTAATHHALVELGIPLDPRSVHTLVDVRRYLPPSDGRLLPGNMAKSVRLDVAPTDVRAVSDALKATVDSARPVVSTLLGGVVAAIPRPRRHPSGEPTGPVGFTFNSMPDLPGLSTLPWLSDDVRQYVGAGLPAYADSVTVSMLRLRTHTQVTAVFPTWMADRATMRRALGEIPERIDELVSPVAT